MKFSLEGFHKVSKDGNTTTLRHPKGHEMTINHSILTPKMRGEIEALPQTDEQEPKKFADGDEVTPVKEVEDSYNKFAGTMKPQPKPMSREEKYKAIEERNRSNGTGETSATNQPIYYAEGSKEPVGEESKDKIDLPKEGEESGRVSNPGNVPVKASGLEASLPDEEAEALKVADASPESEIQQVSNDVPGVDQAQPAEQYDPGKSMLEAHNNMTEAHNNAMKLYAASQQRQPASVQQDQQNPKSSNSQVQPDSQPQPVQAQPALNNAEQAITGLQNYVSDQEKKNNDFANLVSQNKIDPNRLLNNRDTGTKVLNTIGLILGGMGAGATGGKNLAVEALNHAIERDVDAQKSNQANQMNLYRMNLEATHNSEEARNMTINQLLSASQAELNKRAAPLQNALTQANVANVNQEIQQKRIANSQNGYLFKQLQGNGSEGPQANTEAGFQNKMNTLRLLKPDFAKDLEAKYLPGVGVASVPLPEKQRSDLAARVDLSKKLAQLENFSRENSGSFDPKVINQGKALANDIQNAYRSANAQGVFKESEAKFVNSMISNNPTALFANFRTIPGYQQARADNNNTIENTKKAYGVKSFNDSQGSTQNIPDGTKATMKSGEPVIRKNGQWVKQ